MTVVLECMYCTTVCLYDRHSISWPELSSSLLLRTTVLRVSVRPDNLGEQESISLAHACSNSIDAVTDVRESASGQCEYDYTVVN